MNSTREASTNDTEKPVEVDALVLMKIMKHCRENYPMQVSGVLMGLSNEEFLEVTDCFGLQNKRDLWNQLSKDKVDSKDVDEKLKLEDERYQFKMMEQMSLVNADCCNVGWYRMIKFEDLKDALIVEDLCDCQQNIADSIGIAFDFEYASNPKKAFKAFRAIPELVSLRKHIVESGAEPSLYNRLRGKNIIVEVPFIIRNSLSVQAFLVDWFHAGREEFSHLGNLEAVLQPKNNGYVEKSVKFVLNCLEEVQAEQEKLMKHQRDSFKALQKQKEQIERRRLENQQRQLRNEEMLPNIPMTLKKPPAPSPLPTFVMSNEVAAVSDKLRGMLGDNISRSYLLFKEYLESAVAFS